MSAVQSGSQTFRTMLGPSKQFVDVVAKIWRHAFPVVALTGAFYWFLNRNDRNTQHEALPVNAAAPTGSSSSTPVSRPAMIPPPPVASVPTPATVPSSSPPPISQSAMIPFPSEASVPTPATVPASSPPISQPATALSPSLTPVSQPAPLPTPISRKQTPGDRMLGIPGIFTICNPLENPNGKRANFCFINSVFQAWLIFQASSLAQKKRELEGKQGVSSQIQVIDHLMRYILDYKAGDLNNIRPFLRDVLSKCTLEGSLGALGQRLKANPEAGVSQEDAEELMGWLLGFTAEESSASLEEQSYLKGIGWIPNEGNTVFDRRLQLAFEVEAGRFKPGQTLSLAIHSWFEEDVRDQGLKSDGIPILVRRHLLTKAPEELIFSIRRFSRDGSKIQGSLEGMEEILEMPKEYFADEKGAKYRLRSIICHHGSGVHCGHYTTYVRKVNAETGQEAWCHVNDEAIILHYADTKEAALKQAAAGAYILIYDKITS